ncbi:MAG: hypothetical protein WBW71_09995 [Bacteroidota bacterium]
MKILLAYFRLHSVRTAALLYFLIAGALTQVPLFNYVGYEFSAALTIPAALISGLLTIGFIRIHVHQPISRKKFLLVLVHYFAVNGILLLIPLAVMSVNAVAVKNCSFAQGLAYYALLPVCSMIFSVSLAMPLGVVFRRARLIFIVIIAAILSQIVVITYTEPQLFAYNFVIGYFPGITYDESLNNLSTLILYREFTLVASLFFISVFFIAVRMVWSDYKRHENIQAFRVRKGDGTLYFTAFICLCLLVYGHLQRSTLGFEFSASDIQSELGGMATTTHFVLFYPREGISDRAVRFLKAEAEYQYGVDVARMEESLGPGEKISVYLYPTAEAKRRFIGTATTNIAKPWRKEIHLTLDSFEETFRHELVHVLAANVGLPLIGASDRMGLNEGFATAIDWNWGEFSPHEYAAAMQREKLLGNPAALFDYMGFALQQGSYAYIVAASFTRYLIDRFGVRRFKEVFPAGHFVDVYGVPLDVLIGDWEGYLKTVDASALPGETVRTLFAQQSIFRKTCARVTADMNSKAVQAIRVKNFAEAESEFSASFDDAQTSFALRGLFQSLICQKKFTDVVNAYNALGEHSMLRFNPGILLMFGDALWFLGDVPEALGVYRHIEEMSYSEAFSEAAALRRMIVREPRLNFGLRDFFYGSLSDSTRAEILKSLLGFNDSRVVAEYLQANEFFRVKRYHDAGTAFYAVSGQLGDHELSLRCLMNGAEAFYRAGEFEKAKSMFWEAQNFTQSPTMVKQIGGWIERCDIVSAEMD